QGGRCRTSPTAPDRDHRRPPGQTFRARGRGVRGRTGPRAPRGRGGPVQSRDRGCGLGALGGGELMGRIGVVTFPGSLDDRDAARAVRLAAAEPVRLWQSDDSLSEEDAGVLSAGFAYVEYRTA